MTTTSCKFKLTKTIDAKDAIYPITIDGDKQILKYKDAVEKSLTDLEEYLEGKIESTNKTIDQVETTESKPLDPIDLSDKYNILSNYALPMAKRLIAEAVKMYEDEDDKTSEIGNAALPEFRRQRENIKKWINELQKEMEEE